MVFNERLRGSISNVPKIAEVHFLHKLATKIWKTTDDMHKAKYDLGHLADDPKNEVATE